MGSFSWLKADNLTQIANIAYDKPFKFLIPKEFGGGFIKDHYQDYGYLGTKEDGSPKYDIYELLAFWNAEHVLKYDDYRYDWNTKESVAIPAGTKIKDVLQYDGKFPLMKEIDKYTRNNRSLGINIACYDYQVDKLKYPPKLVSASYKGTYEECKGISYDDPNQGFYPVKREDY